MKIQIIVTGWYYDDFGFGDHFIHQLNEIQQHLNSVSVFWACHKEPIDLVKRSFEYQVYDNTGLEWGAYDKALKDLKHLDDETYLFLLQDDILVLDWNFLNECGKRLRSEEKKVIGNGGNHPNILDPNADANLGKVFNIHKKYIDFVKPENKHFFDEKLFTPTVRGSFIATKLKYIKQINGFEYVNEPLVTGTTLKGKEILSVNAFGNLALHLNAYKFTKVFGPNYIDYLSFVYTKSNYMIECGRGKIL